MLHSFRRLVLLFIAISALAACRPTLYVPADKYLLSQNIIKSDTTILEKDKILSLVKQQPNRLILGFLPFHLTVYNIGNTGKPNRFKNWLKSIGEEPAVLDPLLTNRSRNQINLLLLQNGFFNSNVTDSTSYHKRRARVYYSISYGDAYRLRKVDFSTRDTALQQYLELIRTTTLLKPETRYDEELFEEERERITSELKDRGFYQFSKNYISFSADTTVGAHRVDLYVYINRINENVDPALTNEGPKRSHAVYFLRNIYIQTDYDPKNPNAAAPVDTQLVNGYYLLGNHPQHFIRDQTLLDCIFVKSGDRYLQRDFDYSYRRLQSLNVFKFVNMLFREVPDDSSGRRQLDVIIQLTPLDKQDFTLETEATHTGGNLGIAGSFGYRNKNVFRGAEVFEFRIKGALEALPNFSDSLETKRLLFFNTYEIGPEVSLSFKKFLLPGFITRSTSRYFNPRSTLTTGFNYQDRPDFRRSILNLSFGYQWRGSTTQRFSVFPFELNSVYVKPSPGFQARLDSLQDPRLRYSYENHLITAARFSWLYTDQEIRPNQSFWFLRANFEMSGLVMRGIAPLFNWERNEEGSYVFSGIKFSQYIKPDVDVSYHHILNKNNTLVYRVATGIGLPYGNSRALPFEKSFFAGGASSVRAWSARTLGPGSYNESLNIEQSGDFKFEANVEYRSFLLQLFGSTILEGAAFVDAGNVWTRNEDASRPGSQFRISTFARELGIGGGLGMRFNFSFFILRLDMAVKLHDPSLDLSERWVYPNQKFVIGDIVPNLAIGYPF